jgi:hypothetical protein
MHMRCDDVIGARRNSHNAHLFAASAGAIHELAVRRPWIGHKGCVDNTRIARRHAVNNGEVLFLHLASGELAHDARRQLAVPKKQEHPRRVDVETVREVRHAVRGRIVCTVSCVQRRQDVDEVVAPSRLHRDSRPF